MLNLHLVSRAFQLFVMDTHSKASRNHKGTAEWNLKGMQVGPGVRAREWTDEHVLKEGPTQSPAPVYLTISASKGLGAWPHGLPKHPGHTDPRQMSALFLPVVARAPLAPQSSLPPLCITQKCACWTRYFSSHQRKHTGKRLL